MNEYQELMQEEPLSVEDVELLSEPWELDMVTDDELTSEILEVLQ